MTSATARVPAKINLCLGVGPVRDDGFHQLATVYQAIDLCDEVRATATDDGSFTVQVAVEADSTAEEANVPEDDNNIAVRAARLLAQKYDVEWGVDLAIRKVIPVAGGLAGGSADAAGALIACNEIWGLGLSKHELEPLAAELGSDVPFLLHGGNAVGGGRGETVSPVLARGTYHWVLAVSPVGLSTPAVYREFDRLNEDRPVADPEILDDLLAALRSGDAVALGKALSNDLTDASLSLRPELESTLAIGREAGALGALISGSGPTCLFLVHDETHALDVSFALAGASQSADVISTIGPAPGARLI